MRYVVDAALTSGGRMQGGNASWTDNNTSYCCFYHHVHAHRSGREKREQERKKEKGIILMDFFMTRVKLGYVCMNVGKMLRYTPR